MNQTLVDRFMEAKTTIREQFAEKLPECYEDIVEAVCRAVVADDGPDPNNLQELRTGGYQGELLYTTTDMCEWLGFWYVVIDYGSCSGCDTLERIRPFGDKPPTENQLDDYMALALHVVQRFKRIGE